MQVRHRKVETVENLDISDLQVLSLLEEVICG